MDRDKMASFLIELRRKKNLSQANLAELMGVTFQAVSKWERAEAIPDITILEQLSVLYGVTIDEIINGEPKKETPTQTNTNKGKSFLNQNRSYGFLVSLAFLILFFLFGFFSYLIHTNYYHILFSYNYSLGNYFTLLQFLIVMSVPILTMLFYVCSNKASFNKLFSARKIMNIAALSVTGFMQIYIIYLIIKYSETLGVGYLFIQGLIIAYNVLCLVLKKLKKPFIILDYKDEISNIEKSLN